MKIAVSDLKKAVAWIEANSLDLQVRLELDPDHRNLLIKCDDRYKSQVEIKLFDESSMLPKIIREESL